MKLGNEKKCTCCNMTNRYEYLDLNEAGECKVCKSFERKEVKVLDQLISDVNLAEGEQLGVTVSGGKDSIYMWSKLVELFGKERVVAFTYYRPVLTHPLAVQNLQNASRLLDSKLVVLKEDEAFERFKKNFAILLKNPDPAMVRVLLCCGCRYGITENLYREGAKMGINKFVSGASYMELAPFKEELLQAKSQNGDINEGLENGLKLYPELDFDNNLFLIRRDQNYKYKNNETLGNNITCVQNKYKLFDFDDYMEYNPAQIENEVKENLEWKSTERSWHFDCIIEDFKDIFYYGMLGYTEMDFKCAAMVRYKLLTISEAEEKIKTTNHSIRYGYPKIEALLLELGMENLLEDVKMFYRTSKYLSLEEE